MGIFSKFKDKQQIAIPASIQTPPIIEKPKGPFEIGSIFDFLTFNAVGVTFSNGRKSRQTILRRIKYGDEPFEKDFAVTLSLYDFEGSPAISINALDQQIGNVPKDLVQLILENRDRIDTLTEFSIHGGGDHSFGVKVILRFLKQPKEDIIETKSDMLLSVDIPTNYRDYSKAKSFRLTSNANEEMQDNINMVSEGDEVDFDMDYEKDKYLAWAGSSEIGYLPQSGSSFLESIGDNYEADIESIDTNDNDKYVVTVRILPI